MSKNNYTIWAGAAIEFALNKINEYLEHILVIERSVCILVHLLLCIIEPTHLCGGAGSFA